MAGRRESCLAIVGITGMTVAPTYRWRQCSI